MRKDFKLIRIDMRTREVELLEENLTEAVAWDKSYSRELVESKKRRRRYFFAVTPFVDWEAKAKEFIEYRRNLVLP